MNLRFQAVAIALSLVFIAHAEEVDYVQLDVKGLPNSPRATEEGYYVSLLDSGVEALQVTAAASVRNTVGIVESAQLLARDKEGKLVVRALLLPWKLEGQSSSTMEFDLRRDLLENSCLLIKTRKGDTVTVAKVFLGTFHVATREKAKPKN